MSETNGNGLEHPASPLLVRCIAEVQKNFSAQLEQVLQLARVEAGYPERTQFDLQRMVWIEPPVLEPPAP